ncbi:Zinc finger ccch domain-containing protein 18-like [Plakobranchus ocellatus]|uniref:Zinc finger ccch domain-containing protein 18-like n=1 Tax=Plakobranchus ocellatus TaxID=259542 RepID=A0AAV3Z7Z4_9GAST|nr:Zinc finger ccch domain-containing protein 18-like [Plakobranchus ocellatus]
MEADNNPVLIDNDDHEDVTIATQVDASLVPEKNLTEISEQKSNDDLTVTNVVGLNELKVEKEELSFGAPAEKEYKKETDVQRQLLDKDKDSFLSENLDLPREKDQSKIESEAERNELWSKDKESSVSENLGIQKEVEHCNQEVKASEAVGNEIWSKDTNCSVNENLSAQKEVEPRKNEDTASQEAGNDLLRKNTDCCMNENLCAQDETEQSINHSVQSEPGAENTSLISNEVVESNECHSGLVPQQSDLESKDGAATSSLSEAKDEKIEQDNASFEPLTAGASAKCLAIAVQTPSSTNDYVEIQSYEGISSLVGPSHDREDISDGEFDFTAENLESKTDAFAGDVVESHSEQQISESGAIDTLKADKGIKDLKLEDTGKSDAGSVADDASGQSKGPSEDLEAVSDEELPEASHIKTVIPPTKALIEGGEDVSSEDEEIENNALIDESIINARSSANDLKDSSTVLLHEHEPVSPTALPLSPTDLAEPVSPTALPEPVSPTALPEPVSPTHLPEPISPTHLPEPISPTHLPEPVSPTNLPEPVSPTALSELAPLDAEPISDEEDNTELGDEEEEGEAGEIKSPTEDITSPPSSPEQSGANLGEVEPVSADDSNDTDGELPSGDEDDITNAAGDQQKTDVNFESIESEEEGDLGVHSHTNISSPQNSAYIKKVDNEYMESISDEDNVNDKGTKLIDTLSKSMGDVASSDVSVKSQSVSLQPSKDADVGKKVTAPNFNEHQVELDYEETEADDAETKLEESNVEPQTSDGGDDSKPKDADSDKDEGELSDDDCEEGEIKEPGARKPFIKPMCRFFQRGNCTWGINCRFLHPGVNDKGNYQMIEIPGFQPTGVHARLGGPGPWAEPQPPVEQIEIPPPPLPDTPPPETAWERGLRIAKEQRKKATERKEKEPDFEEKRLNLSVDEERELNKENERVPRIIPKDPYYDQQAYEEDEYYKISRDPWQTGHYENFEVRYNREPSYSPPPYREKPPMPMPPPMRYNRPYSPPPPVDKFGRDRMEKREEYRPKPAPPPPVANDYPSPTRRPDEWVDPWRRQTTRKPSKSPTRGKHKRSRSRGGRGRRSLSDSSNSSRSLSGSSSGSSRSSRSYSGSSGSSSRSRSPEPAPPGVERHDRYQSPSRDQPRSAVSVRGRGGGYHNSYDPGHRRDQQQMFGRTRGGGGFGGGGGRGDGGGYPNRAGGGRGGGGGGPPGPGGQYNSYGGNRGEGSYGGNRGGGEGSYGGNRGGGEGGYGGNRGGGEGYPNRDMRGRGRDDRMGRPRAHSPPGRPLPYVRPRPRSASSRSSSSRSRSRSRSHSRGGGEGGRGRYSSSRSSSGSSSSRSSSSSSVGSADSEHLYRDLGSPGKSPTHGGASSAKKKRGAPHSHKDRGPGSGRAPPVGSLPPPMPGSQRHPNAVSASSTSSSQQQRHHMNLDHIPIPRDSRDPREVRREGRDSRDTREARDSRTSRDANMAAAGASGGRSESRYASRNAPQAPIKAKDPLKVVGQKSNIKLTLLPKQQQSTVGTRPNPLDSPPHKRRMSDRESPPGSAPPAKRPLPQSPALRVASEKAAKIHQRQEKGQRSPPPQSMPPSSSQPHHLSVPGSNMPPSSSSSRARAPVSPQKQPSSGLKSRGPEPSVAKTAPKMPSGGGSGSAAMSGAAGASSVSGAGSSTTGAGKAKKSMSSRREELLKQLKAVEDAIARKKTKLT